MDKKRIYYIIEWVIAVAACAWLAWKLATYDDYAALGECLRNMGWQQWLAIGLCVALMPLNMTLEAWRWHSLMNDGMNELRSEGLSWREAHRHVYYSKLAGLITPWRLGEYPSRAIVMESERPTSDPSQKGRASSIWPKVLSMGAVGSATMTLAIIATGAIAMILEVGDWRLETGYYFLIAAALLLLIIALLFAPRLLRRWADVSHKLVAVSFGQSLVRLLCWCMQLLLVLYALNPGNGLGLPGDWLLKTPIYYLLVTITPNVPIAEVGVRGAWAIAVFGTVNAALAGVLLWAINTLLPCLVWFFLRKKR